MASAWGDSWGDAWGDSWGVIDGSSGGGGSSAANVRARLNLLSPADKVDESLQPRLYDMVESLLNGRSRNAKTVTLDASSTTTLVKEPLFESHQVVLLQPMSSAAALELAAGTVYVSARTDGSFTITHASASDTDRTFGYVFVG